MIVNKSKLRKKNLRGDKVKGRSCKEIREIVVDVKRLLKIGDGKVDMSAVFEYILPTMLSGFEGSVLTRDEMDVDEGRTYPDEDRIELRSDVYDKLCNGDGRANFTLAHEIGHLVLHRGVKNSKHFARSKPSSDHEYYEDTEWQADTFASEFLMPFDGVKLCRSPQEVKEKYGVSLKAATVRFNKVH